MPTHMQPIPHNVDHFHGVVEGIRYNNGKAERYAERMLIRFSISREAELLDTAYALRYQVFDRDLAMFFGDDSTKRESDILDDHSWHAFLFFNEELASYARLIRDNAYGFPSEHYHAFPLDGIRASCVELSRATSVKKWRRSNAIWLGFMFALRHCADNGIDYVLGFSNDIVFNRIRRLGLSFHYTGDATHAYNRTMHPYIIDVRKSLYN